jgi:hypothetical protein
MMRKNFWLAIVLFFGIAAPGSLRADEKPASVAAEYKLLYSQEFGQPESMNDFTMTDPKAWRLATADKDHAALELLGKSKYKPPHRSPVNFALLKDLSFGDFVIDLECLQTGREYGHRDMIVVFGFQSPAKFYYTHIATKADDHANQIFIVDDAPRKKISTTSNDGNKWGLNEWRHVRVERKLADGTIKVYFEDMEKPIMVAEDKTFGVGWLGFGSFDDTGKIRNVKIWGPSVEKKEAPAFSH